MSRFLQLHILTEYPISNPNRDDLGRPKSAMIGGVERQRISSQAIKRAIRFHDAFRAALDGHLGDRTQRMGEEIIEYLKDKHKADDKKASDIAKEIVTAFGKLETAKNADLARTAQLAFISPDERKKAFELAEERLAGKDPPKEKDLAKAVMRAADGAVDIAMFGRMLADNADLNRDAAVQVAHAFTVNAGVIADDFYTAVDDLKKKGEDAGAGFIGETGFGSGVYYLYICVNRELLTKNLAGDATLAARGIDALVRAAAMAVPTGKINSYANHVRAKYILALKGNQQPLNLAGAFTVPVKGPDLVANAIDKLIQERESFIKIYGEDSDEVAFVRAGGTDGSVTLAQLAAFAAEGL